MGRGGGPSCSSIPLLQLCVWVIEAFFTSSVMELTVAFL